MDCRRTKWALSTFYHFPIMKSQNNVYYMKVQFAKLPLL